MPFPSKQQAQQQKCVAWKLVIQSAAALLMSIPSLSQSQAQSLQPVPVITTAAGGAVNVCAGATDAFGNGCLATQAKLKTAWASLSDGAGNLYIADSGNAIIRRVDAKSGVITLFAGGAATVCAGATNTVGDGCPATQAKLNSPRGMVFDRQGNLVFIDTSNQRVRKIDAQTGVITTIAGTGTAATACPANSAPVVATATAINNAVDIAFDTGGNLYIPSSARHCIVLIAAVNGVIVPDQSLGYNLAGTGTAGSTGDNSAATAAQINAPRGILVDPAGNIIFTEFGTNKVRKITTPFPNGAFNLNSAVITTIAGTGTVGSGGDGGPATAATLSTTSDVDLDPSGNLYVLQNTAPNSKVRVINRQTGIINTYVGTGLSTETGDGGPAVNATMNGPFGTSVDRFGHLFTDDYTGNTVRSVSLDNLFTFTPVGTIHAAQNIVLQASTATMLQSVSVVPSAAPEFAASNPSDCALGGIVAPKAYCTIPVTFAPKLPGLRRAQLLVTDGSGAASSVGLSGYGLAPSIGFVSAAISTVAGTGLAGTAGPSGPATSATLNGPRGGAVDTAGNFYFADSGNHQVRKVTAAGVISTVAGTGAAGFSGDGSSALQAQLSAPAAVAIDPAGNFYICDSGNNRIRFVDAVTGVISTIAGGGSASYTGDFGDATSATLKAPQGLAIAPDGVLYVADTGNHVVRRFFPKTGNIITVAGNGTAGFAGDGGAATSANLKSPSGIALDSTGNLYIADSGNAVVRLVSPNGLISTFAGRQGTSTNAGDNGPALSASLVSPSDVAVDPSGALYIASGGQVRLVTADGVISSVAGSAQAGAYSGEGDSAVAAVIPSAVANLAVSGNGDLYLFAKAAQRILRVSTSIPRTIDFGVQAPNSTGSAQSLMLLNTGNAPLVFSNITVSPNFVLQSGASNACAPTSTLAPGQGCTLSLAFSPTTTGTLTGSVTLKNNALNDPAGTQSITLVGISKTINITATSVTVSPSTLTYGSSFTATATVSGGSATSGNVVFSVNGSPVGTSTVSAGKAITTIAGLPAGTRTLVATYGGDSNNASSAGSLALVIQPAILKVTATNASAPAHTATPAFQYAISGFVNGDTASAVTGAPSITTTATIYSQPGTYPITIAAGTLASTNYTFTFVNATLTLTAGAPFGYTLTALAPIVTAAGGDSIADGIAATPFGGYSGTITFACSGVPSTYHCYFAPSSLSLSGTAQQATQLTLQRTIAKNDLPNRPPGRSYSQMTIVFAMSLPLTFWMGRRRRKNFVHLLKNLLMLFVTACAINALVGCGTSPAQTTGSYTITVTASDGGLTPNTQSQFTFTIR